MIRTIAANQFPTGMIRKIKGFFERRRLQRVFSKMVSPSVVAEVLDSKSDFEPGSKLEKKTLGVILVLLRYSTHAEVARHISHVASLAGQYGASLENMANCLMVFCYGRFPNELNPEEKRHIFVEALLRELGNKLRIVHGSGEGHIGLVGSKEMVGFTFLMPKFNEALGILSHLKDGEVREVVFS